MIATQAALHAAAKYRVLVRSSDEDSAFVAVCPEFPGLPGQAKNEEAAIGELREAIAKRSR